MQPIQELDALCPYCGEAISLLVEYGQLGESHIEDCQVCCRPIRVMVSASEEGELRVDLIAEDE